MSRKLIFLDVDGTLVDFTMHMPESAREALSIARKRGHPNPTEDIIKRYHELGGEIITIGADAHKPEHVAFDFAKVPDILKAAGFQYFTVFEKRKPAFLPL